MGKVSAAVPEAEDVTKIFRPCGHSMGGIQLVECKTELKPLGEATAFDLNWTLANELCRGVALVEYIDSMFSDSGDKIDMDNLGWMVEMLRDRIRAAQAIHNELRARPTGGKS